MRARDSRGADTLAAHRIAVAGSHAVGKSTLVAEIASALPGFAQIDEPYVDLVESGHLFGDPPSIEDYEIQLEHSLASITEVAGPAIFDRSPFDFVAYLMSLGREVSSEWLPALTAAARRLDLIVFVPIERPDRISISAAEYPRLRTRVDRILRELLLDDSLGLEPRVLEVGGSVRERAAQVLTSLRSITGARGSGC